MKIEDVIICGAGAAGANTLLNLLCVHPELNYKVVDFDKVELRNITPGTQPYAKADLNRPKVQALQRIAQQQRDKRIEAVNMRLNTVQDIRKLIRLPGTVIVDAFDNAPSRNLLFHCDKHPAPTGKESIIHIGFSHALEGEATWNESYSEMVESKADARIDVCEMHLARPFINILTGMATKLISDFVVNGRKTSIGFRFADFKVTRFE